MLTYAPVLPFELLMTALVNGRAPSSRPCTYAFSSTSPNPCATVEDWS
ncbi:hypothetical protein [Curtobacterium sp. 24E2]|nr:hypothetical protein JN350_05555 [Curtobacterium sp. 24E2]